MGGNLFALTDQNFQAEITEAKLPVLVDFWASWCGPCQMLTPLLEELTTDFAGRVVVAKLNVEENHQTVANFGVMSIPTLILFKNGKEVTRITGFRPKEELVRLIDQALQ